MSRLFTLLCTVLSLNLAAQCPVPEIIQVIEFQRAARVLITGIDSTADSLQLLLGPSTFPTVVSTPDTIYTFRGNLFGNNFNLFDLEPGTGYRVVARVFCDGQASNPIVGGEFFTTEASGPPENDGRLSNTFLGGAIVRCIRTPGTTLDATGPDLTDDEGCGGLADDDVWYELNAFFSDYFIEVRPIAGTDQDIVMQLISRATDEVIYCADNGGPGESEFAELAGLTEDEVVDVRIFTKSAGTYADFEICHFGSNPEISEGQGCVTAPPVTFDGSGIPGVYVDVVDSSGFAIIGLENVQPLGEVNVSFYGHGGDLRMSDSTNARYASRNVTVVPETQPAGPVGVRIYLSDAEFQQLVSSGAIGGPNGLDVTKIPDALCSSFYPGGGEVVEFRGAGRVARAGQGRGYFVTVGVTSFSEFFIHPRSESLTASTSVTENGKSEYTWELFPNPIGNRLTLKAPQQLVHQEVLAEVYDLNGRQIQSQVLGAGEQRFMDTGAWKRGVYLIVLTGGGHRISARIVK